MVAQLIGDRWFVGHVSKQVILLGSVKGFVQLPVLSSLLPTLNSIASSPARVSWRKTSTHQIVEPHFGGAVTGSKCMSINFKDASKLVSACPHVQVTVGGVEVLLDTGSMMSTVGESFFNQCFVLWGQETAGLSLAAT